MRRTLAIAAAAAALAAAAPALAQPTPREQVGMYIGDTHTNGVATIVTDETGTHPEGYPGFSPINHTAADPGPLRPADNLWRHHHKRHHQDR